MWQRRTRDEFEALAARLAGRVLSGVRYWEIAYEDPRPMWSHGSNVVDALDFGVDLFFEGSTQVGLTWGGEFFQYGISILDSGSAGNESARSWDAAERWQAFLGKEITDACLHWSWVEAESGERTHYPQDLQLTFGDAGPVYVSALDYRDGHILPCADNILVVFGSEAAARLKIGSLG